MLCRMKMFGRMLILRRVAATDMPTLKAETQMHPGIPYFQAILASIGAWGYVSNLVEVCTLLCHIYLLYLLNSHSNSLSGSRASQAVAAQFPSSPRASLFSLRQRAEWKHLEDSLPRIRVKEMHLLILDM